MIPYDTHNKQFKAWIDAMPPTVVGAATGAYGMGLQHGLEQALYAQLRGEGHKFAGDPDYCQDSKDKMKKTPEVLKSFTADELLDELLRRVERGDSLRGCRFTSVHVDTRFGSCGLDGRTDVTIECERIRKPSGKLPSERIKEIVQDNFGRQDYVIEAIGDYLDERFGRS